MVNLYSLFFVKQWAEDPTHYNPNIHLHVNPPTQVKHAWHAAKLLKTSQYKCTMTEHNSNCNMYHFTNDTASNYFSFFHLHQYLIGTKHKSHKALLTAIIQSTGNTNTTCGGEWSLFSAAYNSSLWCFLLDSFVIYFYFSEVGSGIKVEQPLFLDIIVSEYNTGIC